MGIYIKGMKMPEKCGSCDLFHVESPMHCTVVKGHKTVDAPYGMPRPDWCPLVEVPEQHGDLIDRDALLKKTINNPLHAPYIVAKDIRDMPTIIEAEGSEDDADN